MAEPCRVCRAPTEHFATAEILGHARATYARCPACGMVFVVAPDWLDEAYGEAISRLDVGLLRRCQILGNVTAAILRSERLRNGSFLDWAGGYGVLTRLMRDRGYDFAHDDEMTDNIFAGDHQVEAIAGRRFDLVTAFEVLEHLTDPVRELATVARTTDRLLVSTQLLPEPAPLPADWWYYALESGQHVTLYTPRSMQVLARELGYDGVLTGTMVHLFHRGPVSRLTRALVRRPMVSFGLGYVAALDDFRHSLLEADVARLED